MSNDGMQLHLNFHADKPIQCCHMSRNMSEFRLEWQYNYPWIYRREKVYNTKKHCFYTPPFSLSYMCTQKWIDDKGPLRL